AGGRGLPARARRGPRARGAGARGLRGGAARRLRALERGRRLRLDASALRPRGTDRAPVVRLEDGGDPLDAVRDGDPLRAALPRPRGRAAREVPARGRGVPAVSARAPEIAFACPQCRAETTAGLDGRGRCPSCGTETTLELSPAVRERRLVDRCPA